MVGAKNIEAGVGCGVGFGHGFGVGMHVQYCKSKIVLIMFS